MALFSDIYLYLSLTSLPLSNKLAMSKSLFSCIACPFTTCYKVTNCCCYMGEKSVDCGTKTAMSSCNICANTTECCVKLCENTNKCCNDCCTTTHKCCTDCYTRMYAACCDAEVWMKIFWCCNCCCPADGGSQSSASIAVSLATTFPPLGVFYKYGFGIHFWICLLLTTIAYLPGMFYAILVIQPLISLQMSGGSSMISGGDGDPSSTVNGDPSSMITTLG